MLQTPVFWLLYIMFVMVSASGLMATAQIAPIAKDFGVGEYACSCSAPRPSLSRSSSTMSPTVPRARCSAGSRTISAANTRWRSRSRFGGIAYWLLGSLGTAPWAFVLFAALIFLTWGEIFSLFPSTCTDTFGPKFATVNLSLLYTAKGTSAFLTPLANIIKDATGGWQWCSCSRRS